MKIKIDYKNYRYITDNTEDIEEGVLFFVTQQNKKYQNNIDIKDKVTPRELMDIWELNGINIVGVTGTNGKTTTTAIIYSLLIDLGYSVALQGTRGLFINDTQMGNKFMTTPSILETLSNIKKAKEIANIEFFVMEVSSHAIAQNRIEDLKFALKVHTNITADHLDYHKTITEYRRVKSNFFQDETTKLINKDEEATLKYNMIGAYTYAIEESATFKVMAYSLSSNGLSGIISYHKENEMFESSMIGIFNLYNLVASIASVKILTNIPLNKICEMVKNFGGVRGRMEIISEKPKVIVDFAHTADGILKVLESLKESDLVVLFGAGGDRDKIKRAQMGKVVGRFAKRIYVTSDNPRSENPENIIQDILKGLKGKRGLYSIVDRKEAIKQAIEELRDDEVLLILGKGDESYQEIAGKKYPFDDREIAKKFLTQKAL